MTAGASPGLWVTGIGTVNALGRDVETFWGGLLAGACGIRRLDDAIADATGLFGAPVPDPLAIPSSGRPPSRTEALALMAADEAVRQAGLESPPQGDRIAVVLGSTTGGMREYEEFLIDGARGRRASRSRLLSFERAGATDRVAARFGFTGPRYTLHTACASAATAILIGAELINAGLADAALAGGADALARITLGGFRALRLVDPEPCRPFDRNRRGLSLGEGAGVLILERPAAAAARGARPLARFLGGGQSTDAHHLTSPAPDGAGAARAMIAALQEAGLPPTAVDHVNAHGTGTPANDAAEAAAIVSALGERAAACPVTSIKGSIGHTLGAAGAIEAIAAILALRTGSIPHTVGLREPDPAFGLDLVREAPRRGDWKVVLSSSFGFGGANAVVCFARSEA